MRRKDREITDSNEIMEIMKKCDVCRVAFHDEPYPYIVPLNFGFSFENNQITLFFHGANAGKKLALLNADNRVSFEMDCSHHLVTADVACEYTMEFESVCGTGTIRLLNENEKIPALTNIMNQYDKKENHSFHESMVNHIAVLGLTVTSVTGKRLVQKQ